MFKAIRISILLFALFFVTMGTWLTQLRSTDWNNSLWIKLYPINADGSELVDRYIDNLAVGDFGGIENFLTREVERYRAGIKRPVRVELGERIDEQPPALPDSGAVIRIMWWSLQMRWWSRSVTRAQDAIEPDVRIFVRYHRPDTTVMLENSVGLQKGMVGVVNGYASRRDRGLNNVIIAHEFLHTLGASDKYNPDSGHPVTPGGIAEPEREPLYPQRYSEIMSGRIALADDDSVILENLALGVIGSLTASEINLID